MTTDEKRAAFDEGFKLARELSAQVMDRHAEWYRLIIESLIAGGSNSMAHEAGYSLCEAFKCAARIRMLAPPGDVA